MTTRRSGWLVAAWVLCGSCSQGGQTDEERSDGMNTSMTSNDDVSADDVSADDVSAGEGARTCESIQRCTSVEVGQTEECFGPEQNLDRDHVGVDPGCPCSDVGNICINGFALICEDGAWESVIDGPCYYPPGPCDGRVDSPSDCIALFQSCTELSNGQYCGSEHRTALCPDGVIVQDQSGCPLGDATCEPLNNGLYCTTPSGPALTCPGGYFSTQECRAESSDCFQYDAVLFCRRNVSSSEGCRAQGGTVTYGDDYPRFVPEEGVELPDIFLCEGVETLGSVDDCGVEPCLCCGS